MDISPKVWIPALTQIIAGITLIALGLDVEGKTAIAAGLGTLAIGYQKKDPRRRPRGKRERGATAVEVLLALILAVLCVALAVGWNV